MGSWNGTCAVSNLFVTSGTEVAVFLLLENKEKKDFCYGNALYDMCPIPFYGEYDDYGGVENCSGFGLPIVMNALKAQLYEFGQGPNSCHDIEVNRGNLDITKLFEADHEGRLGIQCFRPHNADAYDHSELSRMRDGDGLTSSQQFELDRLAAKIKQEDTFRRVTHVIIHGSVFKDILDKWYIEDYVGDGKGDTGYQNNYKHIYFKDLVDSIPTHVENCKKIVEADKLDTDPVHRSMSRLLRRFGSSDTESWNSPCLSTKWLVSFDRGSSMAFGLIEVKKHINDYAEKEDWAGMTAFIEEALKGAWINSFMTHVNKLWSKQTSAGQDTNMTGFMLLNKSIEDTLTAYRVRYDMDE
jgi:hypothetical protein